MKTAVKHLFKKNFEFDARTQGGGSGNFSGYQMSFHGSGKGDFHRYFLTDEKALAGFDKRAAGTDIRNRRSEIAIPGLAMRGRQDLGESFPPAISFFGIFCSPFFKKKTAHFEKRLVPLVKLVQLVCPAACGRFH
jgi:hypothetical protein